MGASARAVEDIREPGGTPADADLAINNPAEYAWQLFLFMSRQAAVRSAGKADASKSIGQYDPDKPVVWETWALASGRGATQEGSEVYKPKGEKPGAWESLPRAPTQVSKVFSVRTKSLLSTSGDLSIPLNTIQSTPGGALIVIAPLAPLDQEVRMNQASFEFVRGNDQYNLYSVEGLEDRLKTAVATNQPNLVQFPKGAKEIKAQWAKMDMTKVDEEKTRYHWRSVDGVLYKLTAIHFITKDLPLWFWCDFIHVDYETVNTKLPSNDTTTRTAAGLDPPPAKGSKEGERKEVTGTKWANYRLRGTQVSFVDARGNPVILGDPQIETDFPDQSSCMACHARATVGILNEKRKQVSHLPGGEDGDVKPPNPDRFGKSGAIEFLQTDFVWSAPQRAQSQK